jgi:hypothetical protein
LKSQITVIVAVAVAVLSAGTMLVPRAEAARVELAPDPQGSGNELFFTAAPGETNEVAVGFWFDGWWNVGDHKAMLEAVPPCDPIFDPSSGWDVMCPEKDGPLKRVVVDLGDGDDVGVDNVAGAWKTPVTVLGGPGNDRVFAHEFGGNLLVGGPGNDWINAGQFEGSPYESGEDVVAGGDGDDEIRTWDKFADVVYCGAGLDRVTPDGKDILANDCEVAVRPRVGTDPWSRQDGRPIGVTIDGGATFTNRIELQLTVVVPDAANGLRVQEPDGPASLFTRLSDGINYRFALDTRSNDGARAVNVSFDGPGLDPARKFTDSIILDRKRPVVRSRRVVTRRGSFKWVMLAAHDATSGLKSMQFARRRGSPAKPRAFRRRAIVRASSRWVRVTDWAGNVSRWRRLSKATG